MIALLTDMSHLTGPSEGRVAALSQLSLARQQRGDEFVQISSIIAPFKRLYRSVEEAAGAIFHFKLHLIRGQKTTKMHGSISLLSIIAFYAVRYLSTPFSPLLSAHRRTWPFLGKWGLLETVQRGRENPYRNAMSSWCSLLFSNATPISFVLISTQED